MALWHVLIDDVREELRDRFEEYPDDFLRNEPNDVISEIADTNTPLYTWDLMELAAENLNFATDEPELGPAFDGSPTPVNIIAANIYEAIEAECWDEWRLMEDDENV